MAVPYTFGNATTSIPLSQLDTNFATAITIGNTAVYLGNTTTTFGNVTLNNVTINSGNSTVSSESISGNLTFTGTGNRILGDFSNATVASRVAFQTSTVNGATQIIAIPNGSGTVSNLGFFNNSDPTNAAGFFVGTASSGTEARLNSTITGTGTYIPITLYTGGSERMRIDTSGNVGIGTASPSAKVDNTGTFRSTGATDPTSGAGLELCYRGSTYGDVLAYNRTSSTFIQLQIRGEPIIFGNSGGERMRIDSSGNVGIGTASPANNAGYQTLTINGTSGGVAQIQVAGTNTFQIFSNATANYLNGQTALPMAFYTNATERMRIDSSGNFLINTTSTTLYSATSGYGVCYRKNASLDVLVTSDNAVILNRTGTDGSIEEFRKSGTIVGSISVTTTATAYNTSSDYRLKENVQQMVGGLATVSALKPVRYDWVSDKSAGEGFIAHELAEVIPLAVTGEKNAVYEDGSIKPQGVDYSKIVVHLVAAIQELKAELDALKGAQ